jgi:hypothetical protein
MAREASKADGKALVGGEDGGSMASEASKGNGKAPVCGDCGSRVNAGQVVGGKIWCDACLSDLGPCPACSSRWMSQSKNKCRACGWSRRTIPCQKCKQDSLDGELCEGLFLCQKCRPPPRPKSPCRQCQERIRSPNAGRPGYDSWGDPLD